MNETPPTGGKAADNRAVEALVRDIRACRVCLQQPSGRPLPHDPRPILQVSATARLAICGQAPGVRAHASGQPFTDASGVRLRTWLGLSPSTFYDAQSIAIVPMGFCFPGLDPKGSDLPPRRECAELWHRRLFDALPQLELVLLVGAYAQRWHLGDAARSTMTATVRHMRVSLKRSARRPRMIALPHPSWRNNAWLTANPWFESELLPALRDDVSRILRRG